MSSRTNLDDDVVDVTSLSALDVVEMKKAVVVIHVSRTVAGKPKQGTYPQTRWSTPKQKAAARNVVVEVGS